MFASLKPRLAAWTLFAALAAAPALAPAARAQDVPPAATQAGTWTPLSNAAPDSISSLLLLTDGTVMAQGADNGDVSKNWYRLTPDSTGSYVNGTWTTLAPMHHQRLYYASVVMQNGQVFVAGGEYSDGNTSEVNTAEIYNPLNNTWTEISGPSGWSAIGDAPVASLADGRLLLGSIESGQSALYTAGTNSWVDTAGSKVSDNSSTEESWALLADGSVLTVDCTGTQEAAERYVPGSDAWVSAGQTPPGHGVVESSSSEVGPALLLPNGSVLYVGATGHTALYASATGDWTGGPDLPLVTDPSSGQLVQAQAKDAPGCLLVNGDVLFLAGPTGGGNSGYPGGQFFFDYTPDAGGGAGTVAAVPFPTGLNANSPAYIGRMVDLPSGQVLFADAVNQLYVYTPTGGPQSAWLPTISGVTANGDGSYQVSGTQFNGLSQASAYGDDSSDATNYPLVRLTSSTGVVSYARTFNHSTMGVATGSAPVSTNFTVPAGLPGGSYSLSVIANGIASGGVPFTVAGSTTDTAVTVANVSGTPGQTVTLSATLLTSGGTDLANKTLTFTVSGATIGTAVTNGSGVASRSYTIPTGDKPGSYAVGASFAGDANDNASSGSGTLTVSPLPAKLTLGNVTGLPGQTVTLTAVLKSAAGAGLSGQTITFSTGIEGGGTNQGGGTAVTNSSGVATLSYLIPAGTKPGMYPLGAFFGGSPTAGAVSARATLTVKAVTQVTVANVSGARGTTVTLSATLTTAAGAPLSGKTLTFKVDSAVVGTVVTDSTGTGTQPYTVPAGDKAGAHGIAVSFAGDSGDAASSGTGTLTVTAATPLNTVVTVGARSGKAGTTVVLKSILKTSGGAVLSGKTLTYTVNGVAAGSAVTDSTGLASLTYTIPANAPAGGEPISVSFAGDSGDNPSSGKGTLTVS